jgi:hypothetical protein
VKDTFWNSEEIPLTIEGDPGTGGRWESDPARAVFKPPTCFSDDSCPEETRQTERSLLCRAQDVLPSQTLLYEVLQSVNDSDDEDLDGEEQVGLRSEDNDPAPDVLGDRWVPYEPGNLLVEKESGSVVLVEELGEQQNGALRWLWSSSVDDELVPMSVEPRRPFSAPHSWRGMTVLGLVVVDWEREDVAKDPADRWELESLGGEEDPVLGLDDEVRFGAERADQGVGRGLSCCGFSSCEP